MFNVDIHTDGACFGNPGVGGYGAIIQYKNHERIVRGYSKEKTTNNRMELKAVIEAVKALTKPCDITVYTDSQYVCNYSNHDHNWLTDSHRPNRDLWIELISSVEGVHKIKFVKVAGHAGITLNERCDIIAKEQCFKAQKETEHV